MANEHMLMGLAHEHMLMVLAHELMLIGHGRVLLPLANEIGHSA